MSKDLSWSEAIIEVLKRSGCPLHYTEITRRIDEFGLRKLTGATPNATVSAEITKFVDAGENSRFTRTGDGEYDLLPGVSLTPAKKDVSPAKQDKPNPLIQAFGMYWERSQVKWNAKPKLLGRQVLSTKTSNGSSLVDMGEQVGVYLLHDRHRTVYVGLANADSMADRLFAHTRNNKASRWNRFSWFGFYAVKEDGSLDKTLPVVPQDAFAPVLEALLIEVMEPPLNQQRGHRIQSAEFLQEPNTSQNEDVKETLARIEKALSSSTSKRS